MPISCPQLGLCIFNFFLQQPELFYGTMRMIRIEFFKSSVSWGDFSHTFLSWFHWHYICLSFWFTSISERPCVFPDKLHILVYLNMTVHVCSGNVFSCYLLQKSTGHEFQMASSFKVSKDLVVGLSIWRLWWFIEENMESQTLLLWALVNRGFDLHK